MWMLLSSRSSTRLRWRTCAITSRAADISEIIDDIELKARYIAEWSVLIREDAANRERLREIGDIMAELRLRKVDRPGPSPRCGEESRPLSRDQLRSILKT